MILDNLWVVLYLPLLYVVLSRISDGWNSRASKPPPFPSVIKRHLPYFYRFSKTFGCVQRGEKYTLLHNCPKVEGGPLEKSFKDMDESSSNECLRCNIQIPPKKQLLVMIKLQDLTSGPTGWLYEHHTFTP